MRAEHTARLALAGLLLCVVGSARAAPGDVLFVDDFDSNLNNWTVVPGIGDASIGNETSQSGTSLGHGERDQ